MSARPDLPDDLPVLTFADADEFDAWLEANHDSAPGLWIQMAKKASGIASVDWNGAVPVALRWGWIDGQRRGMDAQWFLQRFTPRRARSVWSRVNVEHCERLVANGRMMPAGLAQVEAAKADGRWAAAYPSASSKEVPTELRAALDSDPVAAAAFAQLRASERYSMCWHVQTAKRDDTKRRRAAAFVEQLRARG